jgi:hypothetical protein
MREFVSKSRNLRDFPSGKEVLKIILNCGGQGCRIISDLTASDKGKALMERILRGMSGDGYGQN